MGSSPEHALAITGVLVGKVLRVKVNVEAGFGLAGLVLGLAAARASVRAAAEQGHKNPSPIESTPTPHSPASHER